MSKQIKWDYWPGRADTTRFVCKISKYFVSMQLFLTQIADNPPSAAVSGADSASYSTPSAAKSGFYYYLCKN